MTDDEIDLSKVFGALWRGKWILSLFVVFSVMLGGLYAFRLATPIYEAKSVVLLDTKQERITGIENVVAGMTGETSEVNSEIEILRSRNLLGRVVDRLELLSDPEFNRNLRAESVISKWQNRILTPIKKVLGTAGETEEMAHQSVRDAVISTLLEHVRISNVRNSLVFTITVESEDAAKSALIADAIAYEYTQTQLRVKQEATEKANAWLSNRVAELQVELETAEQAVSEFRASTRLISADALQALERRLKDLRERINSSRQSRDAQRKQLDRLNKAKTVAEKVSAAEDSVLAKIADEMTTNNEPTYEFSVRFDSLLSRATNNLQSITKQLDGLRGSEIKLQKQIEQQSADLIQLQQLQREANATRLLYEHFLTRLKETSAQQGIQQSDSRIISQAVVPVHPASPKRALILGISGVLGLVLGSAVVVGRDLNTLNFKTAAELETVTDHPVLGQIPMMPVKTRDQILPYLNAKPTSAAAEAIRNLRTSILMSNIDNPPKSIVMTSAVPGDGKSTCSIMLAHNFGKLGKSVLLIDGDLRRQTLKDYLPECHNIGLVSLLSGKKSFQQVVQRSDILEADCVLAEDSPVNPADLYASRKFQDLLNEVKQKYDVVIIDTPPLLVVPDARIIGEHVDTILLSVRWDKTSIPQVEEALRVIHNSGQKISGLIFNAISLPDMKRYGFGGKYGAYGAYGFKYYSN